MTTTKRTATKKEEKKQSHTICR